SRGRGQKQGRESCRYRSEPRLVVGWAKTQIHRSRGTPEGETWRRISGSLLLIVQRFSRFFLCAVITSVVCGPRESARVAAILENIHCTSTRRTFPSKAVSWNRISPVILLDQPHAATLCGHALRSIPHCRVCDLPGELSRVCSGEVPRVE